MTKPPAFQLYAKDIYTGTSDLSGDEFGAYMRGLCWSWDNGPLPLDPARRARVLLIERADLDRVWSVISCNWRQTADGFVNDRLEQQRAELLAYREQCAEAGRKSGQSRRKRTTVATDVHTVVPTDVGTDVPTGDERTHEREGQRNTNTPICDLQSASPDLQSASSTRTLPARARQRYGPSLIGSPLDHRSHGWCNDRGLCLPQSLYAELLARLGGHEHLERFRDWLGATVDGLGDTVPGEDVWRFWRSRFEAWQGSTAPTTKGSRTVAAGKRLQSALDSGAELDPFGTKALARLGKGDAA